MDDDFSQSLTPPVSPFAAGSLCELISPRPLCFSCSETKDDPTGGFSTEGYIARGSLKRYSHYSAPWTQHFSLCVFLSRQTLPFFLSCCQCPNKSYKIEKPVLSRLLLQLDPAPAECETDTIEIFGFVWVTETALVESTKLLFGLFRWGEKTFIIKNLSYKFSDRYNL